VKLRWLNDKTNDAHLVHPFDDARVIAGRDGRTRTSDRRTRLNVICTPIGGVDDRRNGVGGESNGAGCRVVGAEPSNR